MSNPASPKSKLDLLIDELGLVEVDPPDTNTLHIKAKLRSAASLIELQKIWEEIAPQVRAMNKQSRDEIVGEKDAIKQSFRGEHAKGGVKQT